VHPVGFIVRICHDARSRECKKKKHLKLISGREESRKYNFSFLTPVAAIERLYGRTRTCIHTIEALPLRTKSTCLSVQNR